MRVVLDTAFSDGTQAAKKYIAIIFVTEENGIKAYPSLY
jgi:hypothetical protein